MAWLPNRDANNITFGKRYQPVFAGKTKDGGTLIVYKNVSDSTFHIQRPDGEFCALNPGAKITEWYDVDRDRYHVEIESSEWSGTASGTRADTLGAEAL